MKYLIILLFFFNFCQNYRYKEKIVDNENGYNVKVIVKIDGSKKTQEINFKHIISQKLCFRFKNKNLIVKNLTLKKLDGYAVTGINIQEYENKYFYSLELYKSNGSPEIFIVYDVNGILIAKMKNTKTKTQYKFFKKGIDSTFFDNIKNVAVYDLTDLLI
jgi:hypothetical protein